MDITARDKKVKDLKKTKGTQVFQVPNDALGKRFVNLLRKYLNSNKYDLRTRGRGARRSKGYGKDNLPISAAEWLAVYINVTPLHIFELVQARTDGIQKHVQHLSDENSQLRHTIRTRNKALNELFQEKEQLQKEKDELQHFLDIYQRDNTALAEKNEELKLIIEDIIEDIRNPFKRIKNSFISFWKFMYTTRIKIVLEKKQCESIPSEEQGFIKK